MTQLFAWSGQSTGVSALASFLPKNTQDWSPSEWTGWISLQSKGLSRVFSNTRVQKHQLFRVIGDSFFSPGLTGCPYSYQRGSICWPCTTRDRKQSCQKQKPLGTFREKEKPKYEMEISQRKYWSNTMHKHSVLKSKHWTIHKQSLREVWML